MTGKSEIGILVSFISPSSNRLWADKSHISGLYFGFGLLFLWCLPDVVLFPVSELTFVGVGKALLGLGDCGAVIASWTSSFVPLPGETA